MTIQELRAVLDAIEAGEPVQSRHATHSPKWADWGGSVRTSVKALCADIANGWEYRLEPKPRQFWLAVRKSDGSFVTFPPVGGFNNSWEKILVREVVDE